MSILELSPERKARERRRRARQERYQKWVNGLAVRYNAEGQIVAILRGVPHGHYKVREHLVQVWPQPP